MSRREAESGNATALNRYIGQVRGRLRLNATVRGVATVAAAALVATAVLTFVLNRYAFPEGGIGPARLTLLVVIVATLTFGLAWPSLRLTRRRAIERAEKQFPELQERLVTFAERAQTGDPFIELLAADTLKVTQDAPPARMASGGRVLAWTAAGAVCAGVLAWMVVAAPGYMGYGASLLWTGPKHTVAPLYEVKVTPGDEAVRRNSDQLVTAQIVGLETNDVKLFARYQSASKWEPVAMSATAGGTGFQFMFAGLPESVEYYVAAGPVQSKHYKFRVVDLPAVKQIQVTYRYPRWTGLREVSEEHGGDLRALEGTDAELTVVMDAPLKDGVLVGDDGKPLKLTEMPKTAAPGEGNRYRGTIHMAKDGSYHVAAIDGGQQVRLSEDYFISTEKANPPSIAIDRPGADYRASPIEEVTIGVKAGADFGLTHVSMHYSVNGGPEKVVDLSKAPGAKTVNGTTMLSLEDYKLVPGDVVSLYATAKDAHAEAKTDISFIQVDPFEREFSQSQQSGGGGGGGGGGQQGDQTDISRREKELIAATWKQQNEKNPTEKQAADMGKVLGEAQAKLREQVIALEARMQSRDLSSANEEFNSFGKDMKDAAAAMVPSADKLKAQAWGEAMPNEQKALQALLRAEATFRKIEVAFGQRGGGGGGGGSAGRDLASLFDLELDTEKNQYETAQTGSPAEEQAKKVDDALAKLDALAKRQEEMAQQQNGKEPTFQQRWQQEMLRREAEQLQREMEQMQGKPGQGQQSASSGSQGQQGSQGKPGQSGQSSGSSGSQGSSQGQSGQQQQASTKDGGADPRVQQALDRVRAANEAMRRAGTQSGAQGQGGQQGQQQSAEAARRAAENLRAAEGLLGGAQQQQAGNKLESLARQAGDLTRQEGEQAARIKALADKSQQQAGAGSRTAAEISAMMAERNRLADERQRLSDGLGKLERGMRDAARETASTQPGTSSKLRDALSGMDESDLTNRVQRTADWLRSGINPQSNGTEQQIAQGLKSLSDQMRQAQQGMGTGDQGKGSQRRAGQGNETAALDHVDKLRSELQALGLQRGQNGQGRPGADRRADRKMDRAADSERGRAGRLGRATRPASKARRQGSRDRVDSRADSAEAVSRAVAVPTAETARRSPVGSGAVTWAGTRGAAAEAAIRPGTWIRADRSMERRDAASTIRMWAQCTVIRRSASSRG